MPGKNLRPLCGLPLIGWTIKAALSCNQISRTVVSTDSREIANVALELGVAVPFLRDSNLAEDDTPTIEVVADVLRRSPELPDMVVTLQPTSPLRNAHHVGEAIDFFKKFGNADSLVSAVTVPHRFHPSKIMSLDKDNCSDEPLVHPKNLSGKFMARNGPAIIISSPADVLSGSLYGKRTLIYEMDQEFSVDIDLDLDFEIAEFLMTKRLKLGTS